ncbi:MAG: symmetrical bis(5'-nucleosyl)-tetraphosphatase [Gammaproteobacteria bacterium]|nr:symmetrical bis(5'-nucleosyl)-tetraphosphatase [Gammaproteobacteria bacterium]
MAIYAIGDIQGCYDELIQLLEKVAFDEHKDQLWFAGDLVNRGPKSLETLDFVKSLGDRAITVLGNHDLHLLAIAYGCKKVRYDTGIQAILDAPHSADLIDWLRHRPLFYHDATTGFSLAHAGIHPFWDLEMAQSLAKEVEEVLQRGDYRALLTEMYGDKPRRWRKSLTGPKRLRFIINPFTRMRYCDKKGKLDLSEVGAPGSQRDGLMPWFNVPGRIPSPLKILFGHWSTLGKVDTPGIYPLDFGCVWGGQLNLLEISINEGSLDTKTHAISCPDRKLRT